MSGILAAITPRRAPGVINGALPDSQSNVGGAGFELQNDGDCVVSILGGSTNTVDWVSPSESAIAALYEAKSVVTAGAFSADPSAGSWIALSTTRSWTVGAGGAVTFDLSIREAATGIVRTTQSVTMVAA